MVSVIIPSYNSENTIGECLNSLTTQSYRGEYEIILADSSDDSTPRIVTRDFPQVQLIRFNQKTDPGTARNAGINIAKGELIAFIDSDCIAKNDWLERIVQAHQLTNYRVIGGAVCNGNSQHNIVAWAGYLAEFREFLPERQMQEVIHVPTCNISYKKDIFIEYGLFQGRYYPQEDLVYNYNLWKNGEKILMDPQIQVRHMHRTGLRNFLNHQKKIGIITARVLKIIQLEGSFLARHSFVAALFSPFLFLTKFFRTIFIFLKYQPDIIGRHILALVPLFLGLIYWASGFVVGASTKDRFK